MKKAEIPLNEQKRLQKLRDYKILDTIPEKIYDDIVTLASQICGTPIAIISLIDEDRQWFKAKVGISQTETPRDVSFCSHAVNQSDVFEIPDATLDDRFYDNPFVVSGPEIRFYAGVPLVTPDGYHLGTICVIDHKKKELTEQQKSQLRILSRLTVSQIELHRINMRLIETEAKAVESAQYATLGTLAAGVAHEINNPLAIILGTIGVMKSEVENGNTEPEEVLRGLSKIEKTSMRVSKVVKALGHFTSGGGLIQNPVQVSKLVENVKFLVGDTVKSNEIELSLLISDDCTVFGSESKLSQLLCNLVINSLDAVVGKQNPWIKIECIKENEHCVIRVSDSGRGIENSVADKMFIPFFTTKDPVKGMGLGLSTSKEVAAAHGGSLSFDSTCEHTSFILKLPVVL